MTIPHHFARYLSGFQPSRVREDIQMADLVTLLCWHCNEPMETRAIPTHDGYIYRAECRRCRVGQSIPRSQAQLPVETSQGLPHAVTGVRPFREGSAA